MILKNITLKNKLKKFLAQNRGITDIILFGSAVRGKELPRDLDILVLFKDKVEVEKEYALRKILEHFYPNISILSKTEKTWLNPAFDARESILFEGKSLIFGQNLAQKYGFSSYGAFKYSFEGWDKLKKTKFYYALNGRGSQKGILTLLFGIKLSDSFILISLEKIEPFRDFLESWKAKYIYFPLLLPTRMAKKEILES